MKRTILLGLLIAPLVFTSNPMTPVAASHTPYQIVNGDFETGDLSGWKYFRLWKDESGIDAFDSSLIHGYTYFDGNYPYGRDGDYQLGITSMANKNAGLIKWEGDGSAEERMGYLRSSDFILGGSGWISFKLGGGRNPSFAYMSVREATTDLEVARFGNRHFNNTTIATTQYGSSISNAEAFLFQYYFDLTTVSDLGDRLYILLCDTAAYNWSILSADSFVTYIPSEAEPTPVADQIANNILPSIEGIDTATNEIVNGYFTTDFSGWSPSTDDPSNGWGRSASNLSAQSNRVLGNADIGVLRSSAFTVTDEKYLRYDWAGGMKYDKEIFVSIKEVGTNIEKLRYVRRDNLANHIGSGWDNHMLNLTSLDSAKKYYLEFADNAVGDYGISHVRTIRTVPESEWTSVTSGDRAVSISGLPLSFGLSLEQEANTYADYFLEMTSPACAAMNGATVAWATLASEYASLSDGAKDYFVANNTIDVSIVSARARYVFLHTKYGTAQSWDYFLTDSNSDPYNPSASNPNVAINGTLQDNTLYLVTLLSLLLIILGASFVFMTKQKNYLR